jgi:hypothetical protein
MTDVERDRDLPQRVKGATRAAPPVPAPSSLPPLSEELRQRMQAAVEAERAGAATQEQEQTTWPPGGPTAPQAANGDVTAPAGKKINGKRRQAARPETGVTTGRTVKPERSAKRRPDDKAGAAAEPKPVARATPGVLGEEDELTEWLGAHQVVKAEPARARPAIPKQDAALARTGRPTPPSPRAAKKAGRRRRGRMAVFAVIAVIVLIAAGSLSVVALRHATRPPGQRPTAAQLRQAAAARNETVAWVVGHVSRDALVACDPVMRAALMAHGFPSRELLLLGQTAPDPFASAKVVVETPAVQGMFGSSLASAWAPDILASFGSGPANITVRIIAQHGAVAYQTALNNDLAARRTAGAAMLGDSQISMPVTAENQLAAGQLDSRLMLALADLAGHRPIRIVQLGNDGPGASGDIPLRFVDLAENVPAAHLSRQAYVNAVRAFLGQVNVKYRPASMTTVTLPDGEAVLRVTVTAPSPLGVFGP